MTFLLININIAKNVSRQCFTVLYSTVRVQRILVYSYVYSYILLQTCCYIWSATRTPCGNYMHLKYRPPATTAGVKTLEQREPERQVSFEEALRLVRPHQQLLEALYRPPRAPTSAAGVQTAGFDSFYDVLWLVHKFERDIELYLCAAHPPPPKPLLLPAAAQTDAAAPKLSRTVQLQTQQTPAPAPV